MLDTILNIIVQLSICFTIICGGIAMVTWARRQ